MYRKIVLVAMLLQIPASYLAGQVQQQWIQRYNGPAGFDDRVNAMTTDKAGNTYVTGFIHNGSNKDFATIKYSTTGVRSWVAIYSSAGNENDAPCCIVADDSGNVFVLGSVGTSIFGKDFRTIKYNSSGQQQWAINYGGSAGYDDFPTAIFVDRSGFIYVTGYSYDFGGNYDYTTIKYNPSGSINWIKKYNGPGNGEDKPSSVKADNSGNVYVTGYATVSSFKVDYATVKYNSFGDQQWVKRYDGPLNGDDFATALDIDISGNIYVTGESRGIETCTDYATVKYNSSGSQIWLARYNDQDSGCEIPSAIRSDDAGNVYVTGSSYSKESQSGDYLTLKYNSSGTQLWKKRYNSIGNFDDNSTGMAIDFFKNVYITGFSTLNFNTRLMTTVKYDSSGTKEWEQIFYSVPPTNYDQAIGISLDSSNNVYIAGYSFNTGTNDDFFTIKYNQTVGIGQNSNTVPEMFSLYQNYPNPFNPKTIINYELPITNYVKLVVYNALGKAIATLVNQKHDAGSYEVVFDGSNLSSGVYYYRFYVNGKNIETKKMILLK